MTAPYQPIGLNVQEKALHEGSFPEQATLAAARYRETLEFSNIDCLTQLRDSRWSRGDSPVMRPQLDAIPHFVQVAPVTADTVCQ